MHIGNAVISYCGPITYCLEMISRWWQQFLHLIDMRPSIRFNTEEQGLEDTPMTGLCCVIV